MSVDGTTEFFRGLEQRGPELLPDKLRGTLRFELVRNGHTASWFVAINRGTVLVSQEDRPADCLVRLEQQLFDRFIRGEAQVIAAFNRNEVQVEGNLPLLLTFRRVFPSRAGTRDPRERARERTSRR